MYLCIYIYLYRNSIKGKNTLPLAYFSIFYQIYKDHESTILNDSNYFFCNRWTWIKVIFMFITVLYQIFNIKVTLIREKNIYLIINFIILLKMFQKLLWSPVNFILKLLLWNVFFSEEEIGRSSPLASVSCLCNISLCWKTRVERSHAAFSETSYSPDANFWIHCVLWESSGKLLPFLERLERKRSKPGSFICSGPAALCSSAGGFPSGPHTLFSRAFFCPHRLHPSPQEKHSDTAVLK